MLDLQAFAKLASVNVGEFDDKPATLKQGQLEAIKMLCTSAEDAKKIGVWECSPGHFMAD